MSNKKGKTKNATPKPVLPAIDPNGKYTEDSAIAMITRNGGRAGHKQVSHPAPSIKVLGAIDFLVKYFGYERVQSS